MHRFLWALILSVTMGASLIPPTVAWAGEDAGKTRTDAHKAERGDIAQALAEFLGVPREAVELTSLRGLLGQYGRVVQISAKYRPDPHAESPEGIRATMSEDTHLVLRMSWLDRRTAQGKELSLSAACERATAFARAHFPGDWGGLELASGDHRDRGDYALFRLKWIEANRHKLRPARGTRVYVDVNAVTGRITGWLLVWPPEPPPRPAGTLTWEQALRRARTILEKVGRGSLAIDPHKAILLGTCPAARNGGPAWIMLAGASTKDDPQSGQKGVPIAIDAVTGADITPRP